MNRLVSFLDRHDLWSVELNTDLFSCMKISDISSNRINCVYESAAALPLHFFPRLNELFFLIVNAKMMFLKCT